MKIRLGTKNSIVDVARSKAVAEQLRGLGHEVDIIRIPAAGDAETIGAGVGLWLPKPIRTAKDLESVIVPDISSSLGYVMEAIKITKQMLNNRVPLIGFAGAPWTIFCYAVEGKGSRDFNLAKELCFTDSKTAHSLLQRITDSQD